MNAFKCDRCGTLYETPYPTQSMRLLKNRNGIEGKVDLCPDCYEKLKDWYFRETDDSHKNDE